MDVWEKIDIVSERLKNERLSEFTSLLKKAPKGGPVEKSLSRLIELELVMEDEDFLLQELEESGSISNSPSSKEYKELCKFLVQQGVLIDPNAETEEDKVVDLKQWKEDDAFLKELGENIKKSKNFFDTHIRFIELQDIYLKTGTLTQEEHEEYQECKRYLLSIGFLRDITSSANDD